MPVQLDLPSYTPGPSLSTSIYNWVRAPLGVSAEELRPDAAYVGQVLTAVYDIRFCEKIFDGWMAEINSVSIKKLDSHREQTLRFYLDELRDDASLCSISANSILQCHAQFAYLMARRMNDASKSWFKYLPCDDVVTTRLADDINNASRNLSFHVKRMKDNLNSFVSTLEDQTIENVDGGGGGADGDSDGDPKPPKPQSWGFFISLTNAVTRIIAAIGNLITRLTSGDKRNADDDHKQTAPPYSTQDSTLLRGAAKFRGQAPEWKEYESFDAMLLYLKEIVPREAQKAQSKLERFDKVLVIMGLEDHMKTGRRVVLNGRDPAAVAKEWRDVAKKYLKELPDDKDLDD